MEPSFDLHRLLPQETDGILMQLDIPSIPDSGALPERWRNPTTAGRVSVAHNNSWGNFNFGVQAYLTSSTRSWTYERHLRHQRRHPQEVRRSNSLYLLKCLGVVRTQKQADWMNANYPQYNQITPGRPRLRGIVTVITGSRQRQADRRYPRSTYGLTLNFGWGISLGARFQGVVQADTTSAAPTALRERWRSTWPSSSWTPDDPGRNIRASPRPALLNEALQTFWMADAFVLPSENLKLSAYVSRPSVTKALRLSRAMVYASATSLFTISSLLRRLRPETAYQGAVSRETTTEALATTTRS